MQGLCCCRGLLLKGSAVTWALLLQEPCRCRGSAVVGVCCYRGPAVAGALLLQGLCCCRGLLLQGPCCYMDPAVAGALLFQVSFASDPTASGVLGVQTVPAVAGISIVVAVCL